MKNKLISSILFIFICFNSNAQIENEIKNFVDSTEFLVNNGRKLLLQKIQDKDYAKAMEVYNYLILKTDTKNCTAFSYTEELYLSCFFGEWANFLNKAQLIETENNVLCYPKSHNILDLLYKKLADKTDCFLEQIQKTDLNQEDKELFEIYFYLMKNGDRDEVYDFKVNKFLRNYPKTKYKDFIDSYLPKPFYDVGIKYFLGSTGFLPIGELKNSISAGLGINFGMEFYLKKAFLSMHISGGGVKLLKDVDVPQGQFIAGDRLQLFDGSFNFGYKLYNSKKFHVAPYLSVGGGYLESTLYEDERDDDKEFSVYDSFVFGAGINAEYKIYEYVIENSNMYSTPSSKGFLSLRFDAGYNFITKYDYLPYKGNLTYARLALVWGIGKN